MADATDNQAPAATPRMKQRFEEEVLPRLSEAAGTRNRQALPRLQKIVLTSGMGKHLDGTKVKAAVKEQVLSDLAKIAGQKAVAVAAKKSVANFKVREGYETHARVTLRGDRMWEFYDRLVSLAIPRIKDFRGIKDKSFDGRGNFSFGLQEQGIFPEVDMTSAQHTFGMNVTLVWSNSTDELSRSAMTGLGFPFVKKDEKRSAA
ncbi:50S ribosomal protein L5 [Phycisphaera mikurensis]|uniref:Large ribosomal subunit protein uL5 n=1 Tax=Phycisphaera mikurensis (strain NBRC 102666 / KCTC 22515 / FYK2301M01) TaxID=1142394 RepID=I0IIH7_PHYMF|nr:50S ribosomal protein L5 [Phycisphaera mikurensis]MBB6442779.1 large subunit ribosomal protein L5 [Phycisphaera mikurensis]BAM05065.1 50S ribosomal protein L5 [Phycisphaera mikurensis NBRC 102666]